MPHTPEPKKPGKLSMKCYRRLNPIKAISFDLDDTLYENWPIIAAAEQAQMDFLHQKRPSTAQTTNVDWVNFKHQVLNRQPELRHNITQLRGQSIYLQLLALGENEDNAERLSQQAFEVFHQRRIKVTIKTPIIEFLRQLAKHYPLIALTNGNACIKTMGLGDIFDFAILAGEHGVEQKPSRQMFDCAAAKLGLNNENILHIGDSQPSDVQGALNANCMAVWYNPSQKAATNGSGLPHIEISEIEQLSPLLLPNSR